MAEHFLNVKSTIARIWKRWRQLICLSSRLSPIKEWKLYYRCDVIGWNYCKRHRMSSHLPESHKFRCTSNFYYKKICYLHGIQQLHEMLPIHIFLGLGPYNHTLSYSHGRKRLLQAALLIKEKTKQIPYIIIYWKSVYMCTFTCV